MEPHSIPHAWLEFGCGEKNPIGASFLIGRSEDCQVVLRDSKVSRRHCMIHSQGDSEFWLVDLQSANGTRLNGRRVGQATRLHNGDTIELAGYEFRFHCPGDPASHVPHPETVTRTIQEIRNCACWLLLGDLVGSTNKLGKLPAEEGATLTGRWLADCRKVIEMCEGTINKYLGDGFLAYWKEGPGVASQVAAAVGALKNLQQTAPTQFRIVLHYGTTLFGGAPSLGEESMGGREVNFTFRMEDLASALSLPALLSESAAHKLPVTSITSLSSTHALPGFEGEHRFYSI